jgi:DNA-binding IclR family transcriptional regulator
MRQVKNFATVGVNGGFQRTPKAQSDRYRIHVIDRAAQILDCFGFDHQELSVSEIGVKTHLHRVGAPIKDYTGATVAAISEAAPSARLSSQKIPTVGRLLVRTAEEISEKLGYEKTIKAKAQ